MQFVRTQAPLPKTRRTVNPNAAPRKSKYDFASMKVGDSDLTNEFGKDAKKAIARLSSAIAIYKRRTKDDRRFLVRVYRDEELDQDIMGVWCLAAKEPKEKEVAETQSDLVTEDESDSVAETTE
jgi:hypothetical protein